VFTPARRAGYFESIGLPSALGYLTILAEVVGGIALILGIKARLVSVALVPVLLGAAYFGHGGFGFNWSNPNDGWKYPMMWPSYRPHWPCWATVPMRWSPRSGPHNSKLTRRCFGAAQFI
jgi:DoxX